MRFKLNYAHARERIVIRKFECPFCNYVHIFAPTGKLKHKKRFSGYTCPKCHKKVTDEDILRKRGEGPKPKKERRKRSKKKEVKETPIIVASQPYVEQIEWRTSGPPPPGNPRRYGVRAAGWRPRSPQPTERTLGEVVMVSRNINPSAPLPDSNPDSSFREMEEMENTKNREALEGLAEMNEKHEKKLALLVVRLDRVEERLEAQVVKLCVSLEQMDSKIQAFSTLLSHIEATLEHYRRRAQ